jgi:hypothetical protein
MESPGALVHGRVGATGDLDGLTAGGRDEPRPTPSSPQAVRPSPPRAPQKVSQKSRPDVAMNRCIQIDMRNSWSVANSTPTTTSRTPLTRLMARA